MKHPQQIAATLAYGLLWLFLSCQSGAQGGPQLGTETNWLKSCETDADCGELSCECGLCTLTCQQTLDCPMPGAVCSEAATAQTCASVSTPPEGLCLAACAGSCQTGESCVEEACIPEQTGSAESGAQSQGGEANSADAGLDSGSDQGGDASAGAGTSSVAGSGAAGAAGVDAAAGQAMSASGSGSGGASNNAGSGGAAPVAGGGSESAGAESGGSNATAECLADLPELTDNCCFEDSDCPTDQLCYDADCTAPVKGRCEAPPPAGSCWSERDCDAGQTCVGGSLAACASLGPDATGTCQVADSVNTDDPMALCETTGGTWDVSSCGDYVCGVPRSCTLDLPGCDCGDLMNFGDAGCEVDPACEVNGASFECGDAICASVGTEYCQVVMVGPAGAPPTYACTALPDGCVGEPSCDCFDSVGGDCTLGADQEVIVTVFAGAYAL